MSDQSRSSHLRVLLEAALKDYKQQTGIELAEHPLAERFQDSHSVESVTAILRDQAQDFKEFREKDKVLKPLKKVLTVLHRLSSAANFSQDVGMHLPPVKAIQTALGILLSGIIDDYSALADLLELIGHFFDHLEIYTKIPPTKAMNEVVFKILVELLSVLALMTKETKQGKLKKLVRKLVGEKKMEAMVQRLDRLTQDEARQTVAQILMVVHGLVENMKVVMDDGEVSVDHLKETLEIMHQVASDLNKAKRDSLQKDIFGWLSPPDPWKNHHAACESRHHGTADWFIHGNTFPEWRTSEAPGSLLWVHGKPGAGKSVLCSTIIEDIRVMRKAGLASLAFFYCDFREDRKKKLHGLLSSFLVQLYHQSDSYFDVLFKFYSEHDKGSRLPSDEALVGCLKTLLNLPGLAPVYLIVDALDECPNPSVVLSPRADVLSLIEELVKTQIRNLHVCVTSRPEPDIKDVLDPLIFRSVSLHDESGQKRDIKDYVKFVIITRPKKGRWKEEHRKLAIDTLVKKSNGIYRWVDCQVIHICDCIPARLPQALVELPETLDETYERTLRGINAANWELAHRMFQFVSVASRPLRVKELADLLAFEFGAGSIPKFHEDWRLEDPVDAVLSTCSTLLTIVNYDDYDDYDDYDYDYEYYGGMLVIHFSHFSVKEFLTSTRLAEATDVISRRYHVSMTPAHTLVAQVCLGILLHLDKDVTRDSLGYFPLAGYAAEHWVDHARFEDVSRYVEDGMKQLFDPRKPHLSICVWISDPTVPWRRTTRHETPLPLPQTPLHYAAVWGLHPVFEFLIIEHSQDVGSRVSPSNETPLHLASLNGHLKAVYKLIEHGADVTAQNSDGETPLHLALKRGNVDVARIVIEHGADVTAQNRVGETPLHIALEKGDVDVARTLIEHGADVTARNRVGETLLHLVLEEGDVDVARILIEHGADVTARNRVGETPLYLASYRGQVEVARVFTERGADLTAQNNDGWTPLHAALDCGHQSVALLLLERGHGADIGCLDSQSRAPLHIACRGWTDVVSVLIDRGVDLNAEDNRRETPLHVASQWGHDDIILLLLDHGADVDLLDNGSWTPLHVASHEGYDKIVNLLFDHGADTNCPDNGGWTPLHLASWEGHEHIVQLLLNHGAKTNRPDNDGWTPLHLASWEGHEHIVRLLLDRGVNANHVNGNGSTPLHLASQEGHDHIVRLLLDYGVDLNHASSDGSTSLHVALQRDHLYIVQLLLEHSADPNHANSDGLTSLHVALQKSHHYIVRLLLSHGANPNHPSSDGSTSLHLASQMGHDNTVSLLLRHGAVVNRLGGDGWTSLHLASQRGHYDVVELLLKHGAGPNHAHDDGLTPLHLASQEGHDHIVRLLIDRGGDANSLNNDGWTPLHLASQRGHDRIVRLLLDRGADADHPNSDSFTPTGFASREGGVERKPPKDSAVSTRTRRRV